MMFKNVLTRDIPFVFMLGLTLVVSASAGDPNEMYDALDSYDQAFLEDCTLDLTAVYPASYGDPSQGDLTSRVLITSNGPTQAMDLTGTSVGPFSYEADSVSHDHDPAGNYVMSHNQEESILIEPTGCTYRVAPQKTVIDQAGSVVESGVAPPRIDSYPAGAHRPCNLLYRYVLPLGRGFSQLIDSVTVVSEGPDGISTVTASGSSFSDEVGTWNLEVDTHNDYLVQKAVFTHQSGKTSLKLSPDPSAGIWSSPVPLYRAGTFALSDYVVSVSLQDYTRETSSIAVGYGLFEDQFQSVGDLALQFWHRQLRRDA